MTTVSLARHAARSERSTPGERVRSVAQAVALPALGLGLVLAGLVYGLLALLVVRALLG